MSVRTPEDVLRLVAGWDGASLTELKGGLNNQTWLVQQGSVKAVLKVDQEVRTRPYNSRPEEAYVQSRAASAGLAGEVLYVDETALMCAWTEGDVGEPASLRRHDVIDRLAVAMRRLHGLQPTGRVFDAMGAARSYVAKIQPDNRNLATNCEQIIETIGTPSNPVLCHNDLVAENIVIAPRTSFLDWEYACDNDPMFDLATVIEHHGLPDEIALRFLDAYVDGDSGRWHQKLAEQLKLYRALYWLWLAARPDTDPDELARAASRVNR